jgi:hypothetical protein
VNIIKAIEHYPTEGNFYSMWIVSQLTKQLWIYQKGGGNWSSDFSLPPIMPQPP